MTSPSSAEWDRIAASFGVGMEQVRRDHLISHVLAALAAEVPTEDVVFLGGTALSRTHLVDGRLSEDIDLMTMRPRTDTANQIESAVRRGLARSHGRPSWSPLLSLTKDARPAVLSVPDGTSVQVQLVNAADYPQWPTEVVDLEQRYSDAPPAALRVLTAAAFGAAKLTAWLDRRAPRDLYDMWALATRGWLDADAVELFHDLGPLRARPQLWMFRDGVAEAVWRRALAHQTRLEVSATEALDVVRRVWLEG